MVFVEDQEGGAVLLQGDGVALEAVVAFALVDEALAQQVHHQVRLMEERQPVQAQRHGIGHAEAQFHAHGRRHGARFPGHAHAVAFESGNGEGVQVLAPLDSRCTS